MMKTVIKQTLKFSDFSHSKASEVVPNHPSMPRKPTEKTVTKQTRCRHSEASEVVPNHPRMPRMTEMMKTVIKQTLKFPDFPLSAASEMVPNHPSMPRNPRMTEQKTVTKQTRSTGQAKCYGHRRARSMSVSRLLLISDSIPSKSEMKKPRVRNLKRSMMVATKFRACSGVTPLKPDSIPSKSGVKNPRVRNPKSRAKLHVAAAFLATSMCFCTGYASEESFARPTVDPAYVFQVESIVRGYDDSRYKDLRGRVSAITHNESWHEMKVSWLFRVIGSDTVPVDAETKQELETVLKKDMVLVELGTFPEEFGAHEAAENYWADDTEDTKDVNRTDDWTGDMVWALRNVGVSIFGFSPCICKKGHRGEVVEDLGDGFCTVRWIDKKTGNFLTKARKGDYRPPTRVQKTDLSRAFVAKRRRLWSILPSLQKLPERIDKVRED